MRVEQGAERVGGLPRRFGCLCGGAGHRRVNQGGKQAVGFRVLHEAVLAGKVFLFGQRFHQVERGVGGRVVEARVGAVVHLAGVHGGHAEAAPDGNEQQSCQQQQSGGHAQPAVGELHGKECFLAQQYPVEKSVHQARIDNHGRYARSHKANADARHRFFGRGEEVEEGCCVQPEPPVAIQGHIDHKQDREEGGHQQEVARTDALQYFGKSPHRDDEQEAGKYSQIPGQRQVQRQAVPYDREPFFPRHVGIECMVTRHEQRFLQHKNTDKRYIYFDKFYKPFFHWVLCLCEHGTKIVFFILFRGQMHRFL